MARRGQAALEFLTTYGWAFLVVLAMIGALAYFGVLEPTKFLPQRCQFGAELHCSEYALNNTMVAGSDAIKFRLNNALPNPVAIGGVEFKKSVNGTYTPCTSWSVGPTASYIGSELYGDVVCVTNREWAIVDNTRERIQIKLIYSSGQTYSAQYGNVVYGEIYANSR